MPYAVLEMEELPDGRWLVHGMIDNMADQRTPAYEVFEETPFWFNERGFINGKRRGLMLYDRKTDAVTLLTDPWEEINNYSLRGSKLVFQSYPWRGVMLDPFEPALCMLDLATGERRELLAAGIFSNYRVAYWKEDQVLFSGTTNPPDGDGQSCDFYTLDITTGALTLFAEVGRSIGASTIVTDSYFASGQSSKPTDDAFYYLNSFNEGSYLNKITPNGDVTRYLGSDASEACSTDAFDLFSEHVLLSKAVSGGLNELYLDGKAVTHFNDAYFAEHSILPQEFHSFTASDGYTMHGYCMKPAGYVSGKKYPCILHVHGDPLGIFGEIYHHEMQVWAQQGYFVVLCNPRGSDGCGGDYQNINGKWGAVDYANLMEFTDEMLAKYPDIDTKRMAVCGESYGGFMTNWVIGHTNRFAAACAQRSISFMSSFEFTSDIGIMCIETECQTTTEKDYMKMWDHPY